MEWCTGVDHPSALFICEVYISLLANEQELFFTGSYGWSTFSSEIFLGPTSFKAPLCFLGFDSPFGSAQVFHNENLWFFLWTWIWHETYESFVDFCAYFWTIKTFASDWDRTPLSFLSPCLGYVSLSLVKTDSLLGVRHWETPPGSPSCAAGYTATIEPVECHLKETLLLQVDSLTPWSC